MTEEIHDHPCLCEVPEGERIEADETLLAAIANPPEEMVAADAEAAAFRVRTDIRSANYGPNAMNNPPSGIMLHHTAGTETSDLPTLTRAGTGVSSNDYVNKQGIIFELVPFARRAWHAGTRDGSQAGKYYYDGNTYYWGIEIENLGNGSDPYPKTQIDAIVWRCRQLRKRWPNIDHPDQIFRHRDFAPSRKIDPSNNFPFTEVRARIMAKSDPTDGGASPNPTPSPEPGAKTLYRVFAGGSQRGAFEHKQGLLATASDLIDKHDEVRITRKRER